MFGLDVVLFPDDTAYPRQLGILSSPKSITGQSEKLHVTKSLTRELLLDYRFRETSG